MSAQLTNEVTAEATELLTLEAMLLDEQDWDGWLALYEKDAEFWMPAWKSERETTSDPLRELSLIYYADRSGLEDRVQRIRSGKSVASTPLRRTAHMVGNVLVEGEEAGRISVKSSFNVHVYDTRSKTQHVFFGRTIHGLVRREAGLRIRTKKVILANDCIPTMLDVYCV
jgi:benzoate/toluate 1,2-dioxygenase subunit beta